MPTVQTPYDAVLHAARDLPKVDTALDAELLGAALLGSVYAVAEADRATALREFVGGFLAHTGRRRTAAARMLRHVFAYLTPDAAGAAKVGPGPHPPRWAAQIGRVRSTRAWAYGDVYGDQTSYLAMFEYDDPETGGSEHAVVALVDHNIGIVKDVFVGWPGERLLAEVRRAAEEDELIWLSELDPARVRRELLPYLEITDALATLPEDGSLATDRALVGARLRILPEAGAAPAQSPPPDPGELTRDFLASPPAVALAGTLSEDSMRYAVRLILDFSQDAPDPDPLRWSPAVAGLLLLDWVHRRAVLDDDDVRALPPVVRAWTQWAGERVGLPAAAVAATLAAIDTMAPEFGRIYRTGERRGPAVDAMAALLADGVDPSDPEALRRWLDAHPNGDDPHPK